MKKLAAISLSLACMLSLCACGTSKEYKPLLDSISAGDYEGIKTELSVLSPEFKADQERQEKYAAVLDALDANDYDTAIAEVVKLYQADESEGTEEIEINTDNWEQYFTTSIEEEWLINGFGEADDFQCEMYLKLKPEYYDKLKSVSLTMDVSYVQQRKCVEFDYKAQKYTILDQYARYNETSTFENEIAEISGQCDEAHRWRINVIRTGGIAINDIPVMSQFEDLKVNRITGTAMIKK